ncbi:hypothetical protein AB1Y20_010319 [Prymnesium parvum]|uniref:Sialyltransferase n=1 Tax=Prymnesium parvum TaxID=97485 RepID=A0AB34K6V5_PRYPA
MRDDCHFQDSDGRCWQSAPRGVCAAPAGGGASALVQHADFDELCRRDPPRGFRKLCLEPRAEETIRLLRELRDPARCFYNSCALVVSSGSLLGARHGAAIDAHAAVLRLNFAPDATQAAARRTAPHSHPATWAADVGRRTTWRLLAMEGYAYLSHYPRLYLSPPAGHGTHATLASIPQQPLLAVACHTPTRGAGRCRAERLRQVFAHPHAASYLINPLLLHEWAERHFRGVPHQKVLSTGMWALAFATQLCARVHVYGFGDGVCLAPCYHYYECGPTSGGAETNQSYFFTDPRATGGYHNFSAQAKVLHRLAKEGVITVHWGSCHHSLGDAPEAYVNRPRRARKRTQRRRRTKSSNRSRTDG